MARAPFRFLRIPNDIGFQAVDVKPGFGIEPGIHFRLCLGGITGHKDFARDTGVVVKLADATKVADAVVRVFIDHGDRTNRNKARLKYVLDSWGFEKFLAAMEEKLGAKLARVPAEATARVQNSTAWPMSACIRKATRTFSGLESCFRWESSPRRKCAGSPILRKEMGDGDIRLTVWQNLLISGVPQTQIAAAEAAIDALGLTTKATSIRAGLIACTGSRGCRFSPPTRNVTPKTSRAGARTACRSMFRSTSISPAVIIPVPSITSATSA